ncbi:PTS system, N-acetylglucosamine-specific IIC component [Sinosporangium album]|uniref:PTS system, N-acetylglucosamine-specific IIC component n=1 Tax=Sinosporangium album TaxID=504805 RepID=A0A1G7VW40_9ACTN|nr:PTS transporter subunit EIIC [Sinosporangium album]SDG64002.1 PTS system, N-acetylglucosamine-specific IIC component [Sinosporangium album]
MSSPSSAGADLPTTTSSFAVGLAVLSRIGRSLMLPIAALPGAALLMRLGEPDLLGRWDVPWLDQVAKIMNGAGDALFDALPLLFAVGVAIGFARKSDGSTALSAVVGYLVWDRVIRLMFFDSTEQHQVSHTILEDGTPTLAVDYSAENPTRVLGGILIGLVTAILWQRYHRVKLPAWLAFFGGRRFVPMVTAVVALILGVAFGLIWPTVGNWVTQFGEWLATHATIGTGIYGLVNRLLIPLGLHHVLNSIVWFTIPGCEAGVDGSVQNAAGDMKCYFAGQVGAGEFMGGFFPVMMFGLPAAAVAIWRCAPLHRRAAVGGIMLSSGLVSFVTGITEPIEFAFVFVAPVLFIVHAVLTGASLAITAAFDGWLGFGFSAGLLDALMNASKSNTNNLGLIMGLGVIYGVIYYVIFTFLIKRLNIMTPGREPEPDEDAGEAPTPPPSASSASSPSPPDQAEPPPQPAS